MTQILAVQPVDWGLFVGAVHVQLTASAKLTRQPESRSITICNIFEFLQRL